MTNYEWNSHQETELAVRLCNRVLIIPQEFSSFTGSWDLLWLAERHDGWHQIIELLLSLWVMNLVTVMFFWTGHFTNKHKSGKQIKVLKDFV